jgi:hypothetical protein
MRGSQQGSNTRQLRHVAAMNSNKFDQPTVLMLMLCLGANKSCQVIGSHRKVIAVVWASLPEASLV